MINSSSQAAMPQQVETKKQKVIAGLQELFGDRPRPDWVRDLEGLMDAPGARSPLKQETTETSMRVCEPSETPAPTAATAGSPIPVQLALKVRPKGAIGLRLGASETESRMPLEGKPAGEPGAQPPRLTMTQYESMNMQALQKVKERRTAKNSKKRPAAAESVSKRPAAKAIDVSKRPAAKAIAKRPAAHEEFARFVRPRCPKKEEHGPVQYKGGVVYNQKAKPAFRCAVTAGDQNTRSCAWKDDIEAAWDLALGYIEEKRRQEAASG